MLLGAFVTDTLSTQLNHSDPLERRKAIVALANRDDRAALDAVTRAALTDRDPAVRELASKAQAHLSKKLNIEAPQAAPNVAASAPARPAPQNGQSATNAQPSSGAGSKPASEEDIAAAKSQVLNAWSARASGDRYGAQIALSRAFVSNPALREDPEVRELAAEVTGLDGGTAVVRLTMPPPGKKKKGDGGRFGVAAGDDGVTVLLIEYVIYFALVVFSILVGLYLARQVSEFFLSSPAVTSTRSSNAQRGFTALFSRSGPDILLWALGSAASSLIGLIIWNVLVQTFCNMAMGSVGGFVRHQSAVFKVTIATTLIYSVALLLWVTLLRSAPQTLPTVGPLVAWVLIINTFGGLGAQIYFVSRAHQIDLVQGFVAVVLTPLIFVCLCGVCLFATGIINRLTM